MRKYATYFTVNDISKVKRLLDDAHEGLSQDFGDKDVGHRQQAVRAEGLDQ